MISAELCHVVWEFIEGRTTIDDLWVQVNELPLDHGIDSQESDVFAAVCLTWVHIPKGIWTKDEGRDYLRSEMRKYPTVYARWEEP